MSILITIIVYLLIMIFLVLCHELGHFVSARIFGVGVEEFGIGFPPRIWGKKRGETMYSINAIPLGGFVKLAGEEDPKVERSLAAKPRWQRIIVLAAGAIMNLIVPVLLVAAAFMLPHNIVKEPALVGSVAPDSPAALAGIKTGDDIIKVNNQTVTNTNDVYRQIQLHLGNPISMIIKHSDGTTQRVTVTPRWNPPQGQGAVGVVYDSTAIQAQQTVSRGTEPFWQAIPDGVTECIQTMVLFKNGIVSMIVGASPVVLLGPVGVAQMTGEVIKQGISPLLEFAAIFSISIGIFNIFPLPSLDGGRIAFVILEWLRKGKRVSPKTEGLVHLIGFMLLLGLIVFVTYGDIARLISGTSFM